MNRVAFAYVLTFAIGSLSGSGCTSSAPAGYDLGSGSDLPPIGQIDAGGVIGSKCGTCTGCCMGTTCIPLEREDNTNCGRRNTTCKKCPGQSVCTSGVCLAPHTNPDGGTTTGPCDSSCSGCCDTVYNMCVDFADQYGDLCGSGGTMCGLCAISAISCESGTCTNNIDPSGQFSITVTQIAVTSSDSMNNFWDSVDLLPDPFACIGYTDSTGTWIGGCTRACADAAICNPTGGDGTIQDSMGNPIIFGGDALLNGQLYISVYQSDFQHHAPHATMDALMGQTIFPVTTSYQQSYMTQSAFGSVQSLTFTIF